MKNTPCSARPTWTQILLGLFIVWQLIFLAVSNFLAFFPHGAPAEGELSDSRSAPESEGYGGPVQEVINVAADITDRWGFLTGQVQAWWLFAPEFPVQATFPAVELRWHEDGEAPVTKAAPPAPVLLLSPQEPSDPCSYLRLPTSADRYFHYETRLGLIMLCWNEEVATHLAEEWRDAVAQRVRRQWKSMRAYLWWRILRFQEEHPELPPPAQAILRIRIYRTPAPGQYPVEWPGPIDLPLTRWKLRDEPGPGFVPLEMFDSISGQFVPVKEKG